MANKVVIFQGSASDTPYTDQIAQALGSTPYDRRIASAHRTQGHLRTILKNYEKSDDNIVAISVAGLSDALSGTLAAQLWIPVVACPPDAKKGGKAKRYSSVTVPSGTVYYTTTPKDAVLKVQELLSTYDFSQRDNLIAKARQKRKDVMIADAALQGVDNPLPHTLWRVGKTRDIYDLGRRLLVNASDRISAFDEVSPTRIPGKGRALNLLDIWWAEQTKHIVPNDYIKKVSDKAKLVRKAKRIDIECIVRGYLYGSMWKKYSLKGQREFYGYKLKDGMQRAEELPEIMFTPTTKADQGHDMPITREEAISKGLVTAELWKELEENSFRLYEHFSTVAYQKGIIIPDFKLEFGIINGITNNIDERPNHDTARGWPIRYYVLGQRQEDHCLDKEYYRQFLEDSGIDSENPPHPLPEIHPAVVEQIQLRVNGMYEVFVNDKPLNSIPLRSLEDVEQELGIKKSA